MLECLIVGTGGFIGTVCRYLISLIPVKETSLFPFKTFLINVAGCFLIGIVTALAVRGQNINPRLVLFLKVGICGGFTTFSSAALETGELIKQGNTVTALCYGGMSLAVGVLAVFAGQKMVEYM